MHSFSEEGKNLECDAPIDFFEAIFGSSQLKSIVRQTKVYIKKKMNDLPPKIVSRLHTTKFGVSLAYFCGHALSNSLIDAHTTPNLKSTICLTLSDTYREIDSTPSLC